MNDSPLDYWTFAVALAGFIAAILIGYMQIKQFREAASNRPRLEVDSIGLTTLANTNIAEEVSQPDYDGPIPDRLLIVMLNNTGKDAALEVSGQLWMSHPFYPVAIPSQSKGVRISHRVNDRLHIVSLNAPDNFKLRRGANFDRLGFVIGIIILEPVSKPLLVKYVFTPLNGEPVEDIAYLDV